jgi:hypothetical protein
VPVELYDGARQAGVADAITAAARAVVGEEHFAGVSVELRLDEASPGWDADVLRDIFKAHSPAQGAAPQRLLRDVGPEDGGETKLVSRPSS